MTRLHTSAGSLLYLFNPKALTHREVLTE